MHLKLCDLFTKYLTEAGYQLRPMPTPLPAPLPIPPKLTDDELEAMRERAAIMEFHGGLPRKEAERLAALRSEITGESPIG